MRVDRFRTVFLALVALAIGFWHLGDGSLLTYDEATTGLRILEMTETGRWVVPTTHHRPDFNKPPVYYWLGVPGFVLLDDPELATRLWSVLFALGCALVVHRVVRVRGAPRWSADLAAWAIVATPLWANETRMGLLDSGFALSMLAGLWLLDTERPTRRRACAAGVVLAAGALIKSPLTLLVIPVIALADLLRTRRVSWPGLSIAAGVALGVVALWLAAAFAVEGRGILAYQQFNYVDRFTRPIWGRDIPPSAYLDRVLRDAPVLASAFVAVLVALAWRARTALRSLAPPLLLFVVWLALCLAMTNRRTVYLVPLVPLAAWTIGVGLPVLVRGRRGAIVGVLMAVAHAVGLWPRYDAVIDGNPHVKAAGIAIVDAGGRADPIATDGIHHHPLAFYARSPVEQVRPGNAHRWAGRHRDAGAARGWFLVDRERAETAESGVLEALGADYRVHRVLESGDQILIEVFPRE